MSIATEITRLQGAKADLKTAIEAKGVTVSSSALLDAYPALVDAIPTGGGAEAEEKLLNFIDYEGTIVDSYDGSEIAGLAALPSAPDHSQDEVPLTFDEWNWTLAEIQSYHTSYPNVQIWVGANYHTTDEKAHFFYDISTKSDGFGVQINLDSYTQGDTVDWGDGVIETISSTNLTHVYSSIKVFHCIVDCSTTKYTNPTIEAAATKLVKVFLPSTVTDINSFNGKAYSLKEMAVPKTLTYFPGLANSASLKSFTVPRGSSSNRLSFNSANALQRISFSGNQSSLSSNYGIFFSCFALKAVTIPSTVASIPDSAFRQCYSLQSITLPSTITSIGSQAFYNCISMYSITVLSMNPPTLGSSAFSSALTKIYVPYSADHSVLNTYKGASNWSNYASLMEELPE